MGAPFELPIEMERERPELVLGGHLAEVASLAVLSGEPVTASICPCCGAHTIQAHLAAWSVGCHVLPGQVSRA